MVTPAPDDTLIVLRPLPSDVPVRVRVRALLKRALRDWQLRCVEVRPADIPGPICPACRALILALAERVYLQHEILGQLAERHTATRRAAVSPCGNVIFNARPFEPGG